VADAVAEIEELSEEVRTCTRCGLHRTANRGVPGEGPVDARIMLVGEAPGFNEDKQGRPFVGAAGRFLEELLSVAGLKREDVYITNVVKHRPPNNRDPMPDELAACVPYLRRQIELINPQVIVTLGRFSLGTFFPGSMISMVHGEIREKDGRQFFAMYHPAAALHQDRLRQTLLDDMKKLSEFLERVPDQGAAPSVEDVPDEGGDPPEQLSLF